MSDRRKTKPARTRNPNIDRVGVALDKEVRAKGMSLARADHRSFSSLVASLIEHAWEDDQSTKPNGKAA